MINYYIYSEKITFKWSGLKAPAEPSRAELPTRRVKFLFPKTSSEEIKHKYFLYKIIT